MIPALRWAATWAILMFQSEVMDKVTRQYPQTTTFLRREESQSGIEPRSFCLPAYALPLGQTGSHKAPWKRTIYIHRELHTHTHTRKHMNTNQLSISHSNVYIQWYTYTSQLVKKYDQYSLNSFPWVSLSPPQPHSHLTVVLGLTL